jgi:quercetin dioxygenase-like cupin family protein
MKVKHYTDVPAENAEGMAGVTVRWAISEKDGAPHFALRVFNVEPGYTTPFHTHWNEHEVYVLSGQGVVRGESSETPLSPGSVILVPGDEKHQFINTGQDVFRFICLVPHAWLKDIAPPKA